MDSGSLISSECSALRELSRPLVTSLCDTVIAECGWGSAAVVWRRIWRWCGDVSTLLCITSLIAVGRRITTVYSPSPAYYLLGTARYCLLASYYCLLSTNYQLLVTYDFLLSVDYILISS